METIKSKKKIKKIVLIGIITLLALYLVGGTIASYFIYSASFPRNDVDYSQIFVPNLNYGDIDHEKYARTEFKFESGKNTLTGYDFGLKNTRGLVLISSGSGGTGDDYMNFVTRFVDDGYRVITYDMTGTAKSEGKGARGVYQGALDVDALLTYVESQSRYDDLQIFLLGHSWGGYGVCAALKNPHRVSAVVSMAGYNDGAEVFVEQGVSMAGSGFYVLYPHLWVIQKITFGSAMGVSGVDGINAVDIPVLIIQGDHDEAITTDGLSIYAHRKDVTNKKTEFLLTEGSHEWLYSSQAAKDYIAEVQENWSEYRESPEIKVILESGDADAINKIRKQWASDFGFDKFLYNEIDESIIAKMEALFDATQTSIS
ncbi:MAG: alpha/beta hydrolase [Clostridiales Family XIII bacterium]|jgi:alpha-beta hydrolase superfamily lysophospholipase|nr:alpha/beta hydrolase [Clostridiales Family XIII bacterium]